MGFCLLLSIFGYAQKEDSLWALWQDTTNDDSIRVVALGSLSKTKIFSDPDTALLYLNTLEKFSLKTSNESGIQLVYNFKGICYSIKGMEDKSIEQFEKLIDFVQNKSNINTTLSTAYNNIGLAYREKGMFSMALSNFYESLKIDISLNDQYGISMSSINIGDILLKMGEHEKSLEYFLKAKENLEHAEDKSQLGEVYAALGDVYKRQQKYKQMIDSYKQSEMLYLDYNNLYGLKNIYERYGEYKTLIGEYKEAYTYIKKAQSICKKKGMYDCIATNLIELAKISIYKRELNKTIMYCDTAKRIVEKYNYYEENKDLYNCYAAAYEGLGKYQKSYKYYQIYIKLNDSIKSSEQDKEIMRLEAEYVYSQKAAADSIQNAQLQKIQRAEIEAKKLEVQHEERVRYGLVSGLGVLALFFTLLARRFQLTRKQKAEIEKKNNSITESIFYAKQIQDTILTSDQYMKRALKEHFVFYQPKDIVSGDFYWIYKPNKSTTMVAVVDCTGHGVPGAFMSILGSSLLNEVVVERGVTDVAEVLNTMRKLMIKSLDKGEGQAKSNDGMDMTLLKIENSTGRVSFAGAGHSLHVNTKGGLTEVNGDLFPVGYFYGKEKPFTSKELSLAKGDCLYLTSDGYSDQFGGEKNKKLGYAHFKQLIVENSEKSMEEQKKVFNAAYNTWKGDNAQIDDVCVMGIRIQ